MEIRWYQLLFQIVNFGILIFLLNRFLYRPILKIVEDRNKKIEDSLKAAEATLKEKEKINELKKLAAAEAGARKEKRGLWADPSPTPPWEWRAQRRSKGQQTTQEIKVVPNARSSRGRGHRAEDRGPLVPCPSRPAAR